MVTRRALRSFALSLSLLALAPAALFLTQPLAAQPLLAQPLLAQDRGPVQRTVTGKVLAKDGSPAKGAVVYLKDTRSSSVKSCIADDDGTYRFVQLSQNTDYELWARNNDKKGASKTISSFDTKNDLVINLKAAE